MATRKSEVQTKPWSAGGRYYDVWIDEVLKDRLKTIEGVHKVSGPHKASSAPYYVLLDPRYDADEVIAEIEALGEGKKLESWNLSICWRKDEEKPQEEISIKEQAQLLGRRAGSDGSLVFTIHTVLEAAEEVYGEGYKETLAGIVSEIAGRLEQGEWL